MDELKYGIVREYDNYDLWYEPITDEIDGFVLRDKSGYIIKMFSENNNSKVSVITAHWDTINDDVNIGNGTHIECSNCKTWAKKKTKYCSHCGAKMNQD